MTDYPHRWSGRWGVIGQRRPTHALSRGFRSACGIQLSTPWAIATVRYNSDAPVTCGRCLLALEGRP